MSHDVLSPLVPLAVSAFRVREANGRYRAATPDEVLHSAQQLLRQGLRSGPLFDSPPAVRAFLSLRLGGMPHEVFAVLLLDVGNRLKALFNPKLHRIGLLPVMVEPTPLQKENFVQLVQRFQPLLIPYGPRPGQYASMPRRSAVAEAQADGLVRWEMKKTAARGAWREIEVALAVITKAVLEGPPAQPAQAAQPDQTTPSTGASHGPVA